MKLLRNKIHLGKIVLKHLPGRNVSRTVSYINKHFHLGSIPLHIASQVIFSFSTLERVSLSQVDFSWVMNSTHSVNFFFHKKVVLVLQNERLEAHLKAEQQVSIFKRSHKGFLVGIPRQLLLLSVCVKNNKFSALKLPHSPALLHLKRTHPCSTAPT